MHWFLVKGVLVASVVMFASTCLMAVENRIDLRIGQARVDDRISTPRLALTSLKEKDKKEELQVTKVRKSSKTTINKVSKENTQRRSKTKRVVAAQ